MLRKLVAGKLVDVSECEQTEEGYYILPGFVDGKDYADCAAERWIWSIGRRYSDGVVLASTSNIFYQNADFECLFLR